MVCVNLNQYLASVLIMLGFSTLYFERPCYEYDKDESLRKQEVVDAFFYLLMAPRITENLYNKTMRDATVTTNTNTLTQNLMEKISTMQGKSDAFEGRQLNYNQYIVTETKHLNVGRDRGMTATATKRTSMV